MSTTTVVTRGTSLAPRISWGAIFAGFLAALFVYLILGSLGVAIGAASVDPATEDAPLRGLGTGALIWTGVTVLIAVLAGGFMAGRLAGAAGPLHGFLSWCVTVVAASILVGSLIGNVLGAGVSLLGNGVAAAGQVAGAGVAAAGHAAGQSDVKLDVDGLKRKAERLLRETGKPELAPENLKAQGQAAAQDAKDTAAQAGQNPQQSPEDIQDWLDRVLAEAKPTLAAADKDALANIIAAETGKSHDEAEQIADRYAQTYQQAMAKYQEAKAQAEAKARELGQKTAEAAAKGAWISLVTLLLGALLAFFAGGLGFRSVPRTISEVVS